LVYYNLIAATTTFNLSDDQKRWLVIGVGLNKVLLPILRDFLKPKMQDHYSDLKTTKHIDRQTHPGKLSKDGKCSLNYGSINNNQGKKAALYDYNVTSAIDLAKLYLQPFMAKFSGENFQLCKLMFIVVLLQF
jgi:hypothetical protein